MGLAIIYLYDSTEKEFDYNGQPLPEAYDVVVDYEINDSYFVTFKHPLDKDEVYKQIKKDMIVTVHTPDGMQPMRIMDNSKGMDEVEFEAWPLFYADMRTKLVRPLSLNNAAGHTAVTQFVNHLVSDTPFKFTTNISDRHDYHTQSQEDAESSPNELFDALEVFKDLVARWNGEVIIDGYDVRVVDRIGEDKDALLYEKKNIASFLDKESIQGVVTRLYGEAQWTEEVEDGDSVDHSISTVVDSPLIDAYSGVVFEKQYTNNNIRTEEDLKRWLNLKFSTENIDKPSRNLEVDTNIIGGKEINTGDGLVLKYLKHDVDAQMRMIGYEYNGFNDKYITIYIGDASESFTGNVQNNIRDVENNVSNKIDRKTDVILNDLGEKIIFSDSEPKGNFKNGDTWFDSAGNIWMWNEDRARWETHPTKDVVDQALKEAQKDIESAREQADLAVEKINTDIADKFTSLDEEILSIEAISSSAQSNASDALDGVENALSSANTALSNSNDALANAQTAMGSASDAQARADDALVNAQNALDGFNGLEIGGRNYILNSKEILADASQSPNLFLKIQLTESIKPGEEFIFQTYYDFLGGSSDVIRVATRFDDGTGWAMDDISVDSSGQILVNRTNTSNRKLGWVYLYAGEFGDTKGNIVKFTKLSLTKGNKPKDWSPAPEDAEQKIASINYELDEINGQLSLTATQSALDALEGVVTDQELEITANAEALALKADKSTVDTINRTVEDHSLEIEANAEGIKLKADSEKVDNLEDKVTNQGLDITANADELALKANQSVVDSLKDTVDDHALEISANAKGLDLKADSETVDALDGTVNSLSTEVGIIAGELSAKADKQTVDALEETVEDHSLDIKANAEGLELKANKDTVDTLAGTVQSLGTEFDIVAGQVNSRVWNTDIETAIDGIEVGGRNYWVIAESREHHDRTWAGGTLLSRENSVASGLIPTKPNEQFSVNYPSYSSQTMYWNKSKEFIGSFARLQMVTPDGGASYNYLNGSGRPTDDVPAYVSYTFRDNFMVDNPDYRIMLVKGNKATDWTPAPEDTDAKFEYIESEFTQTFESFEQEVSSIDGRVTSQEQRIDSVTTTIQEVQSDIEGNTKLINQTKSTVDTHTQTIATIETDLEGKATVVQYNTLVSTVESTIQRIGDAEGNITQIEANIDGLQSTVADKASQTEVTQLATGFNVLATDFENMEIGGRNLAILNNPIKERETDDDEKTKDSPTSFYIDGDKGWTNVVSSVKNTELMKHITLSYWVKMEEEGVQEFSVELTMFEEGTSGDRTATKQDTQEISEEWKFVTVTFEVPEGTGGIRLLMGNRFSDSFESKSWVNALKLEKGTVATDWSPAPEDMATQAQLSVLNDNINLRVTSSQLDSAISDSLSTAQEYADSTAQTAKEAAQKYAETKAAAERELAEIYAGGLVSSEQEERIAAIKNNLSEAQKYAETKADEAKTAADNYTDTVADEKVDIGQVVSQINIETDNILIQSGKLLLDADTVAFSGNAFIPGAYIKDASIDTAQIADLAVSSGKIANLDVNKLSGNRSEFVQSHWNSAAGGNVRINGTGILTTADDGSQTYIQNGITGTRNPNGSTIGQIGYVPDGSGSPVYRIRTAWGAHFVLANRFRDDYTDSMRTKDTLKVSVYERNGNPGYTDVTWRANGFAINGALSVSSNTTLRDNLSVSNNDITSIKKLSFDAGGGIEAQSGNSNLVISASNRLMLYSNGKRALYFDSSYGYMSRNLSMEGNKITNQSDERLKSNIENTQLNSLEAIKTWQFADYDWIDGESDQFGLIAQRTSEISLYDEERDVWSIDSSRQLMMTTHAVQQLANQHENTLELASAAYLRTETHEQKIKRLEERIKELEGKVDK